MFIILQWETIIYTLILVEILYSNRTNTNSINFKFKNNDVYGDDLIIIFTFGFNLKA